MVHTPAWLRLLPRVFSARSFIPDIKLKDIRQVDFHALRRAGYSGVVVDKDNCLTRPYQDALLPHLRPAWDECKAAFGAHNVLVVSNSSGTKSDPTGLGAEALHRETGVPVLIHAAKKPFCSRDIDAYFSSLPAPSSSPSSSDVGLPSFEGGPRTSLEQTSGEDVTASQKEGGRGRKGLVVIGDRLLTDVLLTSLLAVPSPPPPTSPTTASSLPPSFSSVSSSPTTTIRSTGPGEAYNLSILLTSLPEPKDVRPLRLLERLLESFSRRRRGRSLEGDLAFWRRAGIVRPEEAPVEVELEGWKKTVALVGRAGGSALGWGVKGLQAGVVWGWKTGMAAWEARQARRREEEQAQREKQTVGDVVVVAQEDERSPPAQQPLVVKS